MYLFLEALGGGSGLENSDGKCYLGKFLILVKHVPRALIPLSFIRDSRHIKVISRVTADES